MILLRVGAVGAERPADDGLPVVDSGERVGPPVARPGRNGKTSDRVFGVAEIVRYLSHLTVPEPGDVINTWTPGVVLGLPDPKPYLRAGDVVELEIDGLGGQRREAGRA